MNHLQHYLTKLAEQFAATIADGRNMVAIYDAGGKLHISMPFSNKGQS